MMKGSIRYNEYEYSAQNKRTKEEYNYHALSDRLTYSPYHQQKDSPAISFFGFAMIIHLNLLCKSSDPDSLALEDLKGAIIVIPLLLIIGDISVIDALIHDLGLIIRIVTLGLLPIVPLIMRKVVSEGRVVPVLDSLELPIGIEAKHRTEGVKHKAEDRIRVDVLSKRRVRTDVLPVLNGGQEEHHEIDGEEDADEDEDHDHLVAQLVLHYVQQEEEKYTEDRLPQEGTGRDEVQNHHQRLHRQKHPNRSAVERCLLCRWRHCRTQTHTELLLSFECTGSFQYYWKIRGMLFHQNKRFL